MLLLEVLRNSQDRIILFCDKDLSMGKYQKVIGGNKDTHSSFVNVRIQSMSLISQRLTNESALPTAKYLHNEKQDFGKSSIQNPVISSMSKDILQLVLVAKMKSTYSK